MSIFQKYIYNKYMSKFIKENDEPLIYEEIFNEVDRNLFPFEAILKNQNLSDIIFNDISDRIINDLF